MRRSARAAAHWRCRAMRLCVARQIVQHLEPGKLLLGVHMARWNYCRGVSQGAGKQIDDIGSPIGLIGDRRPAFGAKAATHAGRRRVLPRRTAGEAQRGSWDHYEGGDGRRCLTATTVAVAVQHCARCAVVFILDGAAQAVSGRCHRRARTATSVTEQLHRWVRRAAMAPVSLVALARVLPLAQPRALPVVSQPGCMAASVPGWLAAWRVAIAAPAASDR